MLSLVRSQDEEVRCDCNALVLVSRYGAHRATCLGKPVTLQDLITAKADDPIKAAFLVTLDEVETAIRQTCGYEELPPHIIHELGELAVRQNAIEKDVERLLGRTL